MGSEPIYLWHCCRSCSSVNESISYNGIQLLWQHFLAVAAPCERTLTLLTFSVLPLRYVHTAVATVTENSIYLVTVTVAIAVT